MTQGCYVQPWVIPFFIHYQTFIHPIVKWHFTAPNFRIFNSFTHSNRSNVKNMLIILNISFTLINYWGGILIFLTYICTSFEISPLPTTLGKIMKDLIATYLGTK